MKFEEALPELISGKKIRRKRWNENNYITVGEDDLIIDENNYAIPFVLDYFKADDWEIVKEKKKVKLRDLTMEQYEKWMNEQCEELCCDGCFFRVVECNYYDDSCWMRNKELFSDKFLDQEIEVDER